MLQHIRSPATGRPTLMTETAVPIHYTYDPADRLVRSHASGTLNAGDFQAYCQAVLNDPAIEVGFVETMVIDPQAHILVRFRDLLPFGEIWKEYLAKGCMGTLILAQSPAGFGIFRMFESAIDSEAENPDVDYALVESEAEMRARVSEILARREGPIAVAG